MSVSAVNLFLVSLFFYLIVKGLPPAEAPGDAPEGLHCFQQRKVSTGAEAAQEILFLSKPLTDLALGSR